MTFRESGLPHGSVWVVGLNLSGNWTWLNTTARSISIAVLNGTYGFSAFTDAPFYSASPSSGSVTVSGAAATLNISFSSPPLFPLVFNETGLPNGTTWVVNIENSSHYVFYNQTANRSLGFLVPNGTYGFVVIPESAGGRTYEPSPSAGNLTVRGSATFVSVTYGVTGVFDLYFNETGLPPGTDWYVWVYAASNSSYFVSSSTTSSLSFAVQNGAYSYTVYSDDRYNVATPGSGTINVSGANTTVDVAFSHGSLPVLTIAETGLPSGTWWFVSVYSFATGYFNAESNSSSTSLPLPSGTYQVQPQNVSTHFVSNATTNVLYIVSPLTQNATITTSNVTVAVAYAANLLYQLTFRETGLPSGANWTIRATSARYEAFGSSLANLNQTFYVLNGSYTYTASTGDPNFHAVVGGFAVRGAPVSESVTFSPQKYAVTFTEKGLPARVLAKEGWTVVLNGTSKWSPSATIAFPGLPNGTYEALVTGPSGYEATGSGTVNVSGATTVPVTITRGKTATLTFAEKGLAKGETWCMALDNTTECSMTSNLKFLNLTPGPYNYTVVSPTRNRAISAEAGGIAIPASGTLTLVSTAKVVLTFTYVYAATFTESGLTNGTWSVTLKGATGTEFAGIPIGFDLANGTYAYKIGMESGYTVSSSPAKVTIRGGPATVSVKFTAKGTAPSYELGMAEVSSSYGGTTYSIILALSPTTGLTTGLFGLKITAVTGHVLPTVTVPVACKAGDAPSTCASVAGGWYAVLVNPEGMIAATFGNATAQWGNYANGTTSVTLNGGYSLWLLTQTNYAGVGNVISAYGTGTASVSGSASL